jgi:hypothetical protein
MFRTIYCFCTWSEYRIMLEINAIGRTFPEYKELLDCLAFSLDLIQA